LLFLLIFPIISITLSLIFQVNFITSVILFFGLPSLYLSIKNPRIIIKTSIFSFLFSVPLTFIFDYLLVQDNAWYIVQTIFPFRLLGVVAIEQFTFSFLWIFFVISMYENFFDRKTVLKRERIISRPMLLFGLLAILASFILMGLILVGSPAIVVPFAYAIFGLIVGIIPISLFLLHFPGFFLRFIKITIYFFLLSLLVEYVGLNLNQWTFPGQHYLWKIESLGFSFPIEEVVFYFILSTPGLLVYYEYLDDDRR